ncbi:MAG: TPM domain-containing protein [Chitinophagaceae bacterium]|nr:MAG: TPM domain-containing protein [Chitinophagaceae bacterium]
MVTRTKLHRCAGLLVMNLFLLVASHANTDSRTFVAGSPASPGHFRYMLYPLPDTIPAPVDEYVNDFESVLTKAQTDSLRILMTSIRKEHSIVFCIVSIDSSMVQPARFDAFTLQLANYWGVGDREKDNGIVIGFSRQYRRLRIQNGRGIEKFISNMETDSIMQTVIFPEFKTGDFYGGLRAGIIALMQLVRSKKSKISA